MTALAQGQDVLGRILAEIKSRNEETRLKAANDLKDHVDAVARELSGDALVKFNQDLGKRILEMIQGSDNNDKIGAVLAIDKLIDYDGEESTTKITRSANFLRKIISGNNPQAMILATKSIGRLASLGGTLKADFVEFEVKSALEWLQGDRNEFRRHAAVLILKELAQSAPTLIYFHVNQILENLWVALRDSKAIIRESGANCLGACLKIVYYRESQIRVQWYCRLYDECQRGFKLGTAECIHGSLLAFLELLQHTGMFMHERYNEVGDNVLRFKDHRDILIRKTVLSLIPALAKYNPVEFSDSYLHKSMNHLLGQLRKDKDGSIAFTAIGEIAMAVGSNMSPYLDATIQAIKDGLMASRGKSKTANEAPMFQCISMLATAVGQALTKYMHDILDLIFSLGLSEPLQQALIDLSKNIPPLLPTIQDRLLNMLAIILTGQPYRQPGAPARLIAASVPTPRDVQLIENRDPETVTLALNTLGSFDFNGHMLSEFVRDHIISYLEDDSVEVRKAAALTCCQLFVRDPICFQASNHAIEVVSEVLEKLLTSGIADPDPSIRLTVLSSLDERFDRHLAQADNVRSLFIALNDEVFAIREVAITIIGRLANHNPAYVMPSLRKSLIQLLTELEYSSVSRNKEESAHLLSHLIAAAQRLIKPYVEPILKVLLSKSRDRSPGVASSVLNAIGELALVGGEDMLDYLDDLLPLIMETLQDQSSSTKRDAALRALGQIASNTGFVIDPYLNYPNLLDILIDMLKTEQSLSLRRETVKLLGILGALDPYKHKMAQISKHRCVSADDGNGSVFRGLFPNRGFQCLLKILRDPSLSAYHTEVVQAIMYIFKTLGLKCVSFLPQILPTFLSVMRTSPPRILEFHFQQLGILVSIVKQHIRNYLQDIFSLIQEFWDNTSNLQICIISLVEAISVALEGEFKVHLPAFLPHMLQIIDSDMSDKRQPTLKVLHALIKFGSSIEEYMHLIIPVIVKLFERNDTPVGIRKIAIQTTGHLCKNVNCCDLASRLIHPLSRVLNIHLNELRTATMDTLCILAYQLGPDYAVFAPTVKKLLIKHRIQHPEYEMLISKLLRNEPLPRDLGKIQDERLNEMKLEESPADVGAMKKLPVNQQHLKRAWEATQRSTKDDWNEWIRRLSVELLKESPSPALRACATNLAPVYYPLARELFNAGFVSCWSELDDNFQDELVRSLEFALKSPNIPPEILQMLLNLAEFMEHDDKPLPIDIRTLGAFAAKCHAYAKALHYKELEFISEPSTETTEALISINNQLQQPDAAVGILTFAQRNHDLGLKESWYEKLQRWEDALAAYEKKQLEDPNSFDITMGRMRCLHALGEWEALSQLAQEKWTYAGEDMRRAIAPLAAAAAWGLGQWEIMDDFIAVMKSESPDRAFFRAILALHRNQFQQADQFINTTRDLLDTELTALVGESYSRAYSVIVRVQMLAELEEIITYKKSYDLPDRQAIIRKTWVKRLKGCQRNVDVWQRILKIRALVISPKEDMEMWIKFANLCRKSGRLGLSEKTLTGLLEIEQPTFEQLHDSSAPPQIVYAYLKHKWATGHKEDTITFLREFTAAKSKELGFDEHNVNTELVHGDPAYEQYTRLLARCYLKQGEWQMALQDDWSEETIPDILRSYYLATHFDKDWYKAWHAWALSNFEVITYYERLGESVPSEIMTAHIVPAVQGFFRSIALSSGNSLQDTLRLLTLWFKFGYQQEVSVAISEGFSTVSIDTWLQVIPQLIARIHAPSPNVRRLIHHLLTDVGKEHPQALIYPLTVASKSLNASRKRAALAIMDKMRSHSAMLVEQALLVSQELIRVAILWHEMWHEGLEEASRLYFGDRSIEGMFATLEPLHQMLERGPETLREISFNQAFGRDLQEAQEWCKRYKQTLDENNLHQAWDLYYQVFRRINKQLPQLTTLELQYVSPRLLAAQDLELAVPGTYKSGEEIIRISRCVPTFNVITSKQRPRKFTIKGSDGNDYMFLLKGHEDLRQDERVMQLFGLVNTLLATDPETFKRHLNIQRYSVTPLSPNSGLIGWLPNTDTFHALIRDYRESRKILLNIEHRIMLQMAPDYDNLTLMQKVEVFEYALEHTTGQDLYRVLWLKSRNSEAWLDRRTNYTRSLAVMSMVGYILGLGDRHPSNLMLDRFSGKVIHIDFGDCFEVAMHREKFPERIPFRLTRMLTNAMEVSGIEGNFRTTCENVMRVLRENKESLMAVLEAFVYDPLINWRLLTTPSPHQDPRQPASSVSENVEDGFSRTVPSSRRMIQSEYAQEEEPSNNPEVLNQKALNVVNRISNKLTGRDFKPNQTLDVSTQVEKLIQQATSLENLCQCYIGWCAFW
ncbi:PtdIns-3-kinase tor2 [Basidiobolus meristosporus CBS 931.73]|uniref:non-specific serine/threonine protein kinase n=1 Tax=Basidiobolus meristosporus CBS 931.73 TaxID=1314790 RepID=A0A1Y1YP63_9FUNG|nr:PtdIns-3-kinase tor2 [Basidiobolus meristosporus CBS 931.73]|eukprot:ORX99768.1 PtdIns-3-kinase tor2 [Basidiobolus meristosporus CBS 931.73]